MIVVLYNKIENEIIGIEVSNDKYEQSMNRLFQRLKFNQIKFRYFMVLTFTDKESGFYPIKDRYLEQKIIIWKRRKISHRYKYKDKNTLSKIWVADADWNRPNITNYVRMFFSRIQTYTKKYDNQLFTYFWKFELGEKTNRPHFHVLYDYPKAKGITKRHWEFMESRWRSGYVDIEPIDDSKKALYYLNKYFTKENKKSIFILPKQRKWSSSRDLPAKTKNSEYIYIGNTFDWNEYYTELKYYDMNRMIYDEYTNRFIYI